MKIFNQSNNNFLKDLKSFLDFRNEQNFDILDQEVKEIIDSVKLNGDCALIDYTKKFDNHKISDSEILIPQDVKNKYKLLVDKKIIKSFEISIKNRALWIWLKSIDFMISTSDPSASTLTIALLRFNSPTPIV